MEYESHKTGNGGNVPVPLWYWKNWTEHAGKYLVCLPFVSVNKWARLGGMEFAVVDDFGNLVAVPA